MTLLLVLTSISISLFIAGIVYQAVTGHMGFNWDQNIQVTKCSDSYLVDKLSREGVMLYIAFIGIILGFLVLIPCVVLTAIGVYRFVKRGK